jgi:hypothetical protein
MLTELDERIVTFSGVKTCYASSSEVIAIYAWPFNHYMQYSGFISFSDMENQAPALP